MQSYMATADEVKFILAAKLQNSIVLYCLIIVKIPKLMLHKEVLCFVFLFLKSKWKHPNILTF